MLLSVDVAAALLLLLAGGPAGPAAPNVVAVSAFVPPTNPIYPSWLLRSPRPLPKEEEGEQQPPVVGSESNADPPTTKKPPVPNDDDNDNDQDDGKSTTPLALLNPVRTRQKRAESSARSHHDNRSMNSLLNPVPEQPTPQICSFASPEETSALGYGTAKCRPYLPSDFPPGALLRIGPNGAAETDGFLDGDGMVLCIVIPPGAIGDKTLGDVKITLSQTYIDTQGRKLERHRRIHGPPLSQKTFGGSLGSAPRGLPILANLAVNAVAFQTLTALKDTCNTALAEHGGRVLALMEQCPPTEIGVGKDGRVRTVRSMVRLDGAVPSNDVITGGAFGAHGRTCPETGRRFHVTYRSSSRPYARVDMFALDGDEEEGEEDAEEGDEDGSDAGGDAVDHERPHERRRSGAKVGVSGGEGKGRGGKGGWKLRRTYDVDVPTPVMMHDFALTSHYVVLFDLPLTVRPTRLLSDRFPVEFEPDHGARIGLLRWREDGPMPSEGGSEDDNIQWFDVEPGVVLHAINAHESADGTKVIVHALRSVPDCTSSYILCYTPAYLHEWVLDLRTGTATERCLNPDVMVDFPTVMDVSKPARYGYGVSIKSIGGPVYNHRTPEEVALLDGMVKYELVGDDDDDEEEEEEEGATAGVEGAAGPIRRRRKGDIVDKFVLPPGWFAVSEPTIVPKASPDGGGGGGGDGGAYALLIATNVPDDEDVPVAACNSNTDGGGELGRRPMRSQLLVLDVSDMREPVAAIDLPHHVPNGLHSMFLDWDKME